MLRCLTLVIALFLLDRTIGLQACKPEPYQVKIQVNKARETVNAPNLVDLTRDVKHELEELAVIFTPGDPVALKYNFRGVLASAAFATNSNVLVVKFLQTGNTLTFEGATREESLVLFKDFIHDAGPKDGRLLKAYARYSPIDPIAGNPNSLMAQMAQADYLLGRISPLSGCDCSWNAQPIVHQFQLGLNAGRSHCEGFKAINLTFPMRYSYSPDLDWAFIIDAPLTIDINGGATSASGSLGIGFRYPVTYEWSLTPIFRAGAGGSLDLCTAGSFITAGLTSNYRYKISDYVLSMTNYAGYCSSTNLWLSGIDFNYRLHNWIFKNGLSLTSCNLYTLCDRPINFSLSFTDSYFARDRLFLRHFDEIGLSFITNDLNPCLDYDCLILGFAYQFGQEHYRGWYVSAAYQF